MSLDDPRWRALPVFRELFRQWRAARGRVSATGFRQPFRRSWETLLEDADLLTGEARREADRDARALAQAGLIELKTVRYRPYQIERLAIPLEAEARLRTLFAEELAGGEEPRFDPAGVAWQPELAFLRQTRCGVAGNDLLKLNRFLAHLREDEVPVPLKERSLEIFGDEKRLDALRNTILFDEGRLTPAHLRCFTVAEPLGWQRGPRPDRPVLVIENVSTWESYCRWNATHGCFSAIVYGGGNRFLESAVRLADLFAEIGGPRRVLYFGDLDPQGLRIPQVASRRATSHGLPAIEPDAWSYARMLELGTRSAAPQGEPDALEPDRFAWLGPSAESARAVLESGLRIAQEHLGWKYLSVRTAEDRA